MSEKFEVTSSGDSGADQTEDPVTSGKTSQENFAKLWKVFYKAK
jgi:hypothetical protein